MPSKEEEKKGSLGDAFLTTKMTLLIALILLKNKIITLHYEDQS